MAASAFAPSRVFDRRDDGAMLMHRLFRNLAAETGAEDMDMDVQPRQ